MLERWCHEIFPSFYVLLRLTSAFYPVPSAGEWNASGVVKTNTMPTVLLRAGRVLEPIVLPKGNKKKMPSEKGKKNNKK